MNNPNRESRLRILERKRATRDRLVRYTLLGNGGAIIASLALLGSLVRVKAESVAFSLAGAMMPIWLFVAGLMGANTDFLMDVLNVNQSDISPLILTPLNTLD